MHAFDSDLSVRRKQHMSKNTVVLVFAAASVCVVAGRVERRERSLSRSFGLERRTGVEHLVIGPFGLSLRMYLSHLHHQVIRSKLQDMCT